VYVYGYVYGIVRIDVGVYIYLTYHPTFHQEREDPFVSLHPKAGILKRHPDLINFPAVDGRGPTHRLAVPYAEQASPIIHLPRLLTRECG
jgi:hypothetical protein